MIDSIIDITLLSLLVIQAIAIIRIRSIFAVIMLFSGFSFISAMLFIVMDAADVAFTEAAVGAGISTILMLTTMTLIYTKEDHRGEKQPSHKPWLPLVVVLVTGGMLIYGTSDIPAFGDPNAPAQQHVAPYYLEKSLPETGVPNVVTAVLASYRGFDTLGEVTVIFTAGIGVMLLIGGRRKKIKSETTGDVNET
jgi:multicomponent Na+:H+ antiporter subunit B